MLKWCLTNVLKLFHITSVLVTNLDFLVIVYKFSLCESDWYSSVSIVISVMVEIYIQVGSGVSWKALLETR